MLGRCSAWWDDDHVVQVEQQELDAAILQKINAAGAVAGVGG